MTQIIRDYDLSRHTTFGLPARCAAFAVWHTEHDLLELLADGTLPRPFKPIGGGSNLLFTAPFGGTVLWREGACGAGQTLDSVCADYCSRGVWGMENLSGIPGTLGGAVVQNAGAYGTEMADVVTSVRMVSLADGRVLTLGRDEMGFAYRHSILKDAAMAGKWVVTDVQLRPRPAEGPNVRHGAVADALAAYPAPTPQQVRDAILAVRGAKLPDTAATGSAGSFFRNPEISAEEFATLQARHPDVPAYRLPDSRVKVPAAWLIDRAGLKGAEAGGAKVWPLQPLVIVNASGHATAADVLTLEHLIQQRVAAEFGISLHPEVEHIS